MNTAVIRAAQTVTAEAIIAIPNGDQNSPFSVAIVFAGFDPVGVPGDGSESSVGSVGIGDGYGLSVTVKADEATPVEPLTVTVYTPGDTCGTMIIRCATSPIIDAVPTFVSPNVTFT